VLLFSFAVVKPEEEADFVVKTFRSTNNVTVGFGFGFATVAVRVDLKLRVVFNGTDLL
jgi:hypothetical protein